MRDVLKARWTEIGDKLVAMADDFPETRYAESPAPGVRTFAQQLRHVAFWNQYLLKTLRGEKADGEPNELPADEYASRQAIVDVLRESVDDVTAKLGGASTRIESAHADSVVSFIEHSGEHYGQLVLHYRLSGLVPPTSR